MATSTNLISGLSSGFDWRSMIDQLMAIEHRPVDLITERKTEYQSKLTEWQKVNTMLLSLKNAADNLKTTDSFNAFRSSATSSSSTAASNILNVSTTTSASPATYNVAVNNLAQSEKISSQNYAATDVALGTVHGASFYGDILINGKVVTITNTDTLADIKDKINAVNSGTDPSNVTASIVSHGSDNYHLVLTSDDTGVEGLSVLEGAGSSGDNILQEMGFVGGTTAIKTATSDGAKSDLFTSPITAIKTLLGLSDAPAAQNVTIGGNLVSIDLSSAGESLTTKAEFDPLVHRQGIEIMAKAYLGNADARTPLASPLYADRLSRVRNGR